MERANGNMIFWSYYRLSLRCKFLLMLTLGLSFYSFVMMRYFKRYAHFNNKKTKNELSTIEHSIVMDIRYAIRVVQKYAPWENVCRHHAYQAKMLCNLYHIPYQIFMGVKKRDDGKFDGHAWTIAQDLMITGFCNPDDYIVQTIFKG